MSKIEKFKINNAFYLDNVNYKYDDALQIKKILIYLNDVNLLKFSDLIYVDFSSIHSVYSFINDVLESNDYFICMRCSVNNKILYISHCKLTEEKTLDIDIVSNSSRKFKKVVGKENIISLFDYYVNIANLFLRKKNYDKLTWSIKNNNYIMKTSTDKFPEYITNYGYKIKNNITDNYEKFELYKP